MRGWEGGGGGEEVEGCEEGDYVAVVDAFFGGTRVSLTFLRICFVFVLLGKRRWRGSFLQAEVEGPGFFGALL